MQKHIIGLLYHFFIFFMISKKQEGIYFFA